MKIIWKLKKIHKRILCILLVVLCLLLIIDPSDIRENDDKNINPIEKIILIIEYSYKQNYDKERLSIEESKTKTYKKELCKSKVGTENIKEELSSNKWSSDSETYETVYATQNVNIRKECDMNSESIGLLLGGESLQQIEKYRNGWSKVLYDGQAYYIKSEYLTNVKYDYNHKIKDGYTYLGEFKITAYCDGSCCNGKWSGTTSTGISPSEGTTIAVAPWIIPYGTEVYIEGVGTRIAQDTGGFANRNNYQIDLFFYDHEDTKIWGVKYRNVWMK